MVYMSIVIHVHVHTNVYALMYVKSLIHMRNHP